MSERQRTSSPAWLLAAGAVLTVAGTLGLVFLDIRWEILEPIAGLALGGARLLASALRMLFTVDTRFSGSLLALLLGISALLAFLYVRYARRRDVFPLAPAQPVEATPSPASGLVRHGWPVAALLIMFLFALARGTTDEFLKDAAEKGLAFLGSMLIAVPIVMIVVLGFLAWDSRKRR